MDIHEILNSPTYFRWWDMFLSFSCCNEGLRFWKDSRVLVEGEAWQCRITLDRVLRLYLEPTSPAEVNISGKLRANLLDVASSGSFEELRPLMEEARLEVLDVLKRQSFVKFLQLMMRAQQMRKDFCGEIPQRPASETEETLTPHVTVIVPESGRRLIFRNTSEPIVKSRGRKSSVDSNNGPTTTSGSGWKRLSFFKARSPPLEEDGEEGLEVPPKTKSPPVTGERKSGNMPTKDLSQN